MFEWLHYFSYARKFHQAGVLGMNARNYKIIAHYNTMISI